MYRPIFYHKFLHMANKSTRWAINFLDTCQPLHGFNTDCGVQQLNTIPIPAGALSPKLKAKAVPSGSPAAMVREAGADPCTLNVHCSLVVLIYGARLPENQGTMPFKFHP